jgi:hypothetical protein
LLDNLIPFFEGQNSSTRLSKMRFSEIQQRWWHDTDLIYFRKDSSRRVLTKALSIFLLKLSRTPRIFSASVPGICCKASSGVPSLFLQIGY